MRDVATTRGRARDRAPIWHRDSDPGGRLAEQAAAVQEVGEDRVRLVVRRRLRHGRHRGPYEGLRVRTVHLRAPVERQPVREALDELDLRGLAELDAVRVAHVALTVAAQQQHRQRRVVQRLAAAWQEAAAVAVQGADQPAHERVGGESGDVGGGAQGHGREGGFQRDLGGLRLHVRPELSKIGWLDDGGAIGGRVLRSHGLHPFLVRICVSRSSTICSSPSSSVMGFR